MNENGIALGVSDVEEERFAHRPLVGAMLNVQSRMSGLKERVKVYYFEVVLSPHPCPGCGGRLKMTGQSLCSCSCGKTFDPTLEFQRSACFGARLVRRTYHYACSRCHEVVPSRFIYEGHRPSLQVNNPGVDGVEKGLAEEDDEERQVERRAVEE